MMNPQSFGAVSTPNLQMHLVSVRKVLEFSQGRRRWVGRVDNCPPGFW